MAPRFSVKAEITGMKASGNFFTKDVSKTITENAKDAVEWLAKQGPGLVARELSDTHGTGFTASMVEGFAYKRTRIGTGTAVPSLYGKVRMKPGLSRSPASAKYPAARRPYITMRVLESGGHGGHREGSRWVSKPSAARVAHHQFKRTAARLRAYSRAIRMDLTKGLN